MIPPTFCVGILHNVTSSIWDTMFLRSFVFHTNLKEMLRTFLLPV